MSTIETACPHCGSYTLDATTVHVAGLDAVDDNGHTAKPGDHIHVCGVCSWFHVLTTTPKPKPKAKAKGKAKPRRKANAKSGR